MYRGKKDLQGRILAGVGLTSLATLMLQVSLTRLFSVSLWHHFAFMVVSISFLGYGASGTYLMMAPKIRGLDLPRASAKLTFALSLAIIASYWCSNRIPFDPARLMWDGYQCLYLLGYYVVLAVPFFFAGLTLAMVYTTRAHEVGWIYAWDLVGAGLGCMAMLWLYAHVGEARAVMVVSLIAGAASLAFTTKGWRLNVARAVWLGVLCLSMVTGPGILSLNISPYKPLMRALKYPGARLLETRWDSAGRLDIIKSGAVRFAPGLSLEFQGRLPEQLGLCQDGGNLNGATRFNGNIDELAFTESLPASLPYVLTEPRDVLITEPMGGLDILSALYHGATNIVTTHSSPLVLDAMKTVLGPFSGHIYENHVTPFEEQARSLLLRTAMAFDIIQVPLADSSRAVSSGLYGLSEEYSLTVEAFKTYLGSLKPEGFLTITQYLLPPPRHEIRLAGLAYSALEAMDVENPENHVGAIRSWGAFTLVVKRSPFEPHEVSRMKDFCSRLRFDLVHYPNMPRSEANTYNRFPSPFYYDMVQKVLDPGQREAFYDEYLFDVRPTTDDRPFFYHNFRMDKVIPLYRAVGEKWQLFLEGGYLVHLIFVQAMVVSLVLIALPIIRTPRAGSSWFLAYFGLIGVAFMLTEICLIKRFILFLARPTSAFSVVLFSVLVSSAFGSYCSRRAIERPRALVITPILVLAYALFLDNVLTFAIAWPLWARHVTTFLLILPLGFTMGMFFPMGIRILRAGFERAIPWAWSVNGCASVAGSVLAAVVAVSWGFTAVLLLASLCYSLALAVLVVQNLSHHRHKDYSQ